MTHAIALLAFLAATLACSNTSYSRKEERQITDKLALLITGQFPHHGPAFFKDQVEKMQRKLASDPKDVEAARENEPLKRAKEKLLAGGIDTAELEAMEKAIIDKLEALETWALEQEFPTLEQGIDHVGIPLENAPEVRGPQSLVL